MAMCAWNNISIKYDLFAPTLLSRTCHQSSSPWNIIQRLNLTDVLGLYVSQAFPRSMATMADKTVLAVKTSSFLGVLAADGSTALTERCTRVSLTMPRIQGGRRMTRLV